MPVEFEVSTTFNALPEKIYHAWLDSTQHGEMTGGGANTSTEIGGEFTAWDGYITGRNVELIPGERIVQTWRTSEFETSDPDSNLEVIFESLEGGTKLTLRHTKLPAHGMQYKQGWVENYFEPMKQYFED